MVVIILGILAALVSAVFADSADDARRTAFVTDVRIFRDAAYMFYAEQREFPEDASSGTLPAGFGEYADEDKWTAVTPIGGVWDFEQNSFGITSGFGVHFDGTGMTRDDAYMTLIDEMCDDGDLTTGRFQKIDGARYYEIIEP